MCYENDVKSPMLYQSPDDSHELLLVGIAAETIQDMLNSMLVQQFPSFRIFTENISSAAEHYECLSKSSTFEVFRYELDSKEKVYIKKEEATCELILQAVFCNTNSRYVGYLAAVPAHFILTDEECVQLKENFGNSELVDRVEKQVAQRIITTRFDMELFGTKKQTDLRLKPPMWGYRHQRTKESRADLPDYHSFLNDLVLFELEMKSLSTYVSEDEMLSEEDLQRSMCLELEGKRRDVVLALRNPKHLTKMGLHRVCVRVGPVKGHMILSEISLVERGKKRQERNEADLPLAYNAQFVITE